LELKKRKIPLQPLKTKEFIDKIGSREKEFAGRQRGVVLKRRIGLGEELNRSRQE
jgi:hypothetical protein